MGIEGLSWHMVGFPAWEIFPHLLGSMLVVVPQGIMLALGVE